MIRAAILTISYKSSKGKLEDITALGLKRLLHQNGYIVDYYRIIPDDIDVIEKELIYLCDRLNMGLILTSGGTGLAKQDVTPEATYNIIQRYIPGIGEAIRMEAFKSSSRAILYRGIAGIRGETVIINLPGNSKKALENFKVIMPILKYGINILTGKISEEK